MATEAPLTAPSLLILPGVFICPLGRLVGDTSPAPIAPRG